MRGGTVYVVAENAGVHAVSVRNGEGLWRCDRADAFIAAGKGRVLLGAEDRQLICADQQTGEVLWERELPGNRTYRFVSNAENDLIYVCRRRDGHLYCYQFED
jgi:outer membrane protein assembly factor BamB